jgi:hypothetical protein
MIPERGKVSMRKFLVVAAVVFVTSLGSVTNAHSAPTAESLIQEGLELRRSGHDFDALAKFERAYTLSKTPRAAAQWGLCLQAVSRWSEADGLIAEALAATADPWVKKNRGILKDSLEAVKTHVGRVEVLGEPVGANVMVDGKQVGQLPLRAPVPVNEGSIDVEVSAPGYAAMSRTVTVTGSNYQRVVLKLKKSHDIATATPTVAQADVAPAVSADESVKAVANDPAPTATSSGRPLRTVAFISGGVGVAAAATGVFFGMRAKSLGEENSTANTFDPSKDSAGKSAETLQYVFLGVGAAALAAGGVLFFLDSNQSSPESSIAIAPVASPGGMGLIAGGKF